VQQRLPETSDYIGTVDDYPVPADDSLIDYLRNKLANVSTREMMDWYNEISHTYVSAPTATSVPQPQLDFQDPQLYAVIGQLLTPPATLKQRLGDLTFDMPLAISKVLPAFRSSFTMSPFVLPAAPKYPLRWAYENWHAPGIKALRVTTHSHAIPTIPHADEVCLLPHCCVCPTSHCVCPSSLAKLCLLSSLTNMCFWQTELCRAETGHMRALESH